MQRKSSTIHIVCTSARPHLLHGLLSSITHSNEHSLDIKWHVMFKGAVSDPGGRNAVNETLAHLPRSSQDWLLFMCDDNLVHPQLFKKLCEVIRILPDIAALVVSQERHDSEEGSVWPAIKQIMTPGYVDSSQVVIRTDIIGERLVSGTNISDGEFIVDIYKSNRDRFLFLEETLSYFEAAYWYTGGGEKRERYQKVTK